MLKIMRCGCCGYFCDAEGRIFESTKQLIAADELVGFDDCLTACNNCDTSQKIPTLYAIWQQNKIDDIRRNFNRKLSTGKYLDT